MSNKQQPTGKISLDIIAKKFTSSKEIKIYALTLATISVLSNVSQKILLTNLIILTRF